MGTVATAARRVVAAVSVASRAAWWAASLVAVVRAAEGAKAMGVEAKLVAAMERATRAAVTSAVVAMAKGRLVTAVAARVAVEGAAAAAGARWQWERPRWRER